MAIIPGRKPRLQGGRSHTPDRREKQIPPRYKILEQLRYRVQCLRDRLASGKFTEQNYHEMNRLAADMTADVNELVAFWPDTISKIKSEIAEKNALAQQLAAPRMTKKAAA